MNSVAGRILVGGKYDDVIELCCVNEHGLGINPTSIRVEAS